KEGREALTYRPANQVEAQDIDTACRGSRKEGLERDALGDCIVVDRQIRIQSQSAKGGMEFIRDGDVAEGEVEARQLGSREDVIGIEAVARCHRACDGITRVQANGTAIKGAGTGEVVGHWRTVGNSGETHE